MSSSPSYVEEGSAESHPQKQARISGPLPHFFFVSRQHFMWILCGSEEGQRKN